MSSTAWPLLQEFMADWMRLVSKAVSEEGWPATMLSCAGRTVQAVGKVGSVTWRESWEEAGSRE
jgi:hypothetical protein